MTVGTVTADRPGGRGVRAARWVEAAQSVRQPVIAWDREDVGRACRAPGARTVTVPEASWQEALAAALPPDAVVRTSAQLNLEPEPRNVGVARRFVAEQVGDLPTDTCDTVLLLTSELVTNAVVHARTAVEVGVAVTDDDVVVTVHDLDLGRREQRTHERDGGRGLAIVQALAVGAGQLPHAQGGKTAWFRIGRSATPDEVGT